MTAFARYEGIISFLEDDSNWKGVWGIGYARRTISTSMERRYSSSRGEEQAAIVPIVYPHITYEPSLFSATWPCEYACPILSLIQSCM